MIEVCDDVFNYSYACYVWNFVKSSKYQLGWEDDDILEHSGYKCLYSMYSDSDITRLGILDNLNSSLIGHHLKDKKLSRVIVNLAIPGQTFFTHTHYKDWYSDLYKSPVICLYYANLEWKREWGGETMFYTPDNLELEKAIEYRSNRLVCFTGEHPHSIRPATNHAPFYRFTISMFFYEV
jgi:Rps23 Pro-64 3,4-dihydroxylase Tpa1-like proline 4-hydroxylase